MCRAGDEILQPEAWGRGNADWPEPSQAVVIYEFAAMVGCWLAGKPEESQIKSCSSANISTMNLNMK
jgi:hypothetical protein